MSVLLDSESCREIFWCISNCFFFLSHQNAAVAKAEREEKVQRWACTCGKGASQAAGLCRRRRRCCPTADWRGENEAVTFWESCVRHGPQREARQWPGARTKGWFLWDARRSRARQLFHSQAGYPRSDERSGTTCFYQYRSMLTNLCLTWVAFPSDQREEVIVNNDVMTKDDEVCGSIWCELIPWINLSDHPKSFPTPAVNLFSLKISTSKLLPYMCVLCALDKRLLQGSWSLSTFLST